MEYSCQANSSICVITLSGSFTFNDNLKFREIVSLLESQGAVSMELNFEQVDFIDSAALGMLLLLRDECARRNIGVILKGSGGQVQKMFLLSKFDQLFVLQP